MKHSKTVRLHDENSDDISQNSRRLRSRAKLPDEDERRKLRHIALAEVVKEQVEKVLKEQREEAERLKKAEIKFEASNDQIGDLISVTKLMFYDSAVRKRNIFMMVLVVLALFCFALEIWLSYSKKICFEGFDPDVEGNIDARYKDFCMVSNYKTNALKGLISAITLVHILSLWSYYRFQLRMEKNSYWFLRDSMTWHNNAWVFFGVEFVILILHPFPTGSRYMYDDKLGAFMFLRLYQVIRVLRDHSPIYQKRRNLLQDPTLKRTGAVEFNWLLAAKYLFLQNTWIFVLIGVVCTWFIMAYLIWILEREHNYDFTLLTSFWLASVTMSTVGFGDVSPTNNSARLIAAFTAILGIINTSLIVYAVTKTLTLTDQDANLRNIWSRSNAQNSEKYLAAEYIKLFWNRYTFRRKLRNGALNKTKAEVEKAKHIFNRNNSDMKANLRACRRELALAKNLEDTVIESLEAQLDIMSNDITSLLALTLGFYPSQRKKTVPTLIQIENQLDEMEHQLQQGMSRLEEAFKLHMRSRS